MLCHVLLLLRLLLLLTLLLPLLLVLPISGAVPHAPLPLCIPQRSFLQRPAN
jgi:hypothetical protein